MNRSRACCGNGYDAQLSDFGIHICMRTWVDPSQNRAMNGGTSAVKLCQKIVMAVISAA